MLRQILDDILSFFAALFGRKVTFASSQPRQASAFPNAPTVPTVNPTKRHFKTPQDAAAAALATTVRLNPKDSGPGGWLNPSHPDWNTRILGYHVNIAPNECGGTPAPNLKFSEASSLALTGGGIAAKLAPAAIGGPIGLAVLGAGLVISIITAIFTHHAQAVARDLKAICTLVPAVNNAFEIFIPGVLAGQISPQDGMIAMDTIQNTFPQQAGPAYNNKPYCNVVCENHVVIKAICYWWHSEFEAMT